MKTIMTVVLVYLISSAAFTMYLQPPDTLIEPRKDIPEEVKPDTLPEVIPDTLREEKPDTLFPTDPVEVPDDASPGDKQEVTGYAVVNLNSTEGNKGSGRLLFSRVNNGIKITGEILGLKPGLHGIHIHENGDCSAPDASSAGGHFNPDQMPHAGPHDVKRHVGDLGNLVADEQGTAIIDIIDTKISFEGPNSILGKSVVIHAGKDDLKSQPAGDSGGRILCGVIEKNDK